MGFNDLPGDSKPEASAPGLVCYEGTKGVFNLVFCHATSVIRDGDLDTVRNDRSGKKNSAVSMLDRFLRITEKVKKSLTDFGLIQTDLGKITGDVSLKGDSKVVQCRSKGTGNSIQADTSICLYKGNVTGILISGKFIQQLTDIVQIFHNVIPMFVETELWL